MNGKGQVNGGEELGKGGGGEKVSGDFSRGRQKLVDKERREGRWDRREREKGSGDFRRGKGRGNGREEREREKVSGDFSRGRGRLVHRERRKGRWDRRERERRLVEISVGGEEGW